MGLAYANFGDWAAYGCGTPGSCLPTYIGVSGGGQNGVLPTAAMPSIGAAFYSGGAAGYVSQPAAIGPKNAAQFYGTASISANFVTGAVSGTINNIMAYDVLTGQTNLGTINDIGLAATISGAGFSGTTSVTGAAGTAFDISGATGSITGGFYGPNAAETAGVFNLNGGANNTTLVGSFGEKATPADYTASLSVITAPGGVILSPNLGLFGAIEPLIPVASLPPTSPAVILPTPGGYGIVIPGVLSYTNSASVLGQIGDVTQGAYAVVPGTDSKIATGTGSYETFNGVVGLSYASFGLWQMDGCVGGCTLAYLGVMGGSQPGVTLTSAMPTTGIGTYLGGAAGYIGQSGTVDPSTIAQFYGTALLSASFASNSITGSIRNIQAYSNSSGGVTPLGSLNDIGLAATISGASFSGTASVTGPAGSYADITGAGGGLTGGFYGPNASEVGGVFNLSGGAANLSIIGAFGAKQQTTQYGASITLGGTAAAITATPDTALFGLASASAPTVSAPGTPDGFTLTVTGPTPGGEVTSQFGGSNLITVTANAAGQAGNVVELVSSILASTDSAIPTTGSGMVEEFASAAGLSYASFGIWETSPCASTANCLPAYVGVTIGGALQTAAMPTTGSATYTGGAVGFVVQPVAANANNAAEFYGTSSLTANFASNAITGSITNINAYTPPFGSAAQSLLGTINTIGLAATISGSNFAGTTSVTGAAGTAFDISGATGQVSGAFYGPAANEVAAVFNLNGGANNTSLVGSLGARAAVAPSDSRLKREIAPAGMLPNGLKLHSWRYLGGKHRFTGVLAQELLADARFANAVARDGDGLMRVDYARIGYAPADFAEMVSEGEQAVAAWRAARH